MRKTTLAVVITLVLLSSICAQAKSVLLAYNYAPGQIDKYHLSISGVVQLVGIPAPNNGNLDFKVGCNILQKVLNVSKDGNARIKVTYSDFQFTSAAMPQMANQKMPTGEFSAVMAVATDGRVLRIESIEGTSAANLNGIDLSQFSSQMGCYGMFPSVPVEVGQSWTITLPTLFGSGSMDIDSVLEAAAVPVGNDIAAKVKQTYATSIDLGQLMKSILSSTKMPIGDLSQININGQAAIKGWGVLYFSPDKGRLIKSNGNAHIDVNIGLPAQLVQQGAPSQLTIGVDLNIDMSHF